MTKAKKYLVLAISIALLGLAEAVSGFVLWLGFPTGGGGGRGWGGGGGVGNLTFWELSKHTWIVRMARLIFGGTPKRLALVLVKED